MAAAAELNADDGPARVIVVVATLGSSAVVILTVVLASVMVVVSIRPPCQGSESTIEETAPLVVNVYRRVVML